LFAPSKEILTKIERAVTNDKTIMIVALRLHPTAKVDQTFCTYIKKLIVVAAVSYQTYPNPSNALAKDVFILLMGVASSAVPHPTLIHSWRRNGIGIFLFVQVIKRCASANSDAKQITIFLQCQEASSLHFYSMIGFHKINSHSKDGFDMLPIHMQINLKSLRPDDPGRNSAFIFYDKNSDLKPSFLMQLRPGGLRHHEDKIDLELEPQKVCFGFVILHHNSKMEGEWSICPTIFTTHFWGFLSCRVFCQRKVNFPLYCLLHLSQSKEKLVSSI
jgi:hypothetical protein